MSNNKKWVTLEGYEYGAEVGTVTLDADFIAGFTAASDKSCTRLYLRDGMEMDVRNSAPEIAALLGAADEPVAAPATEPDDVPDGYPLDETCMFRLFPTKFYAIAVAHTLRERGFLVSVQEADGGYYLHVRDTNNALRFVGKKL